MIESIHLRICGFIVAAMLIGYGLFSEDGIYFRYVTPTVQTVAKSHTNPATTPAAPVYELTKTRIADIKVGMRVPAFDPQLGTTIREALAEPNWAQWVNLNLEMIKSDGSLLKMQMLRSEDWVLENIDYQFLGDKDLKATSLLTAANSSQFIKSLPIEAPQVPLRTLFAELQDVRSLMAEVEADSVLVTISLDLPEIGVRGEAVVTGVEPCPVILPGPGKVVLTTFHHASSHLIDLYVSSQPPTGQASNSAGSTATFATASNQSSAEALLFPTASRSELTDQAWERIGVTGNHPIWSQDRHDYIAAMDLRIGERLKNLSGDTVWVQQKLARPGPAPVYNLEVQDEHVYYVGTNGVLAHNAGKGLPSGACDSAGTTTYGDARQHGLGHNPLREGDVDQYRYFSNRPGDGLEGHEVWQSANTSSYGLGGRTGPIGGRNPAIAIGTNEHRQIVNKLQSEMIANPASMSAIDNIKANLSVLRQSQALGVGISDRQIKNAGRRAVRFYLRMLRDGVIRE